MTTKRPDVRPLPPPPRDPVPANGTHMPGPTASPPALHLVPLSPAAVLVSQPVFVEVSHIDEGSTHMAPVQGGFKARTVDDDGILVRGPDVCYFVSYAVIEAVRGKRDVVLKILG